MGYACPEAGAAAPTSDPCVTFQVFGTTVFVSGSEKHFKYLEKIYSLEVSWPCEL